MPGRGPVGARFEGLGRQTAGAGASAKQGVLARGILRRLYLEHHESIYWHLAHGTGEQAAQAMFRHLLATQAATGAQWKEDGWEQARAAILRSLPEHVALGGKQPARVPGHREPPRR